MHRTFFAAAVLVALLGSFATRAAADTIYAPAIVAFDADDRFVASHDVQGVVTYFNHFTMNLRVNGREYPVVLHQGTIINPVGPTLAPSMLVNVEGYWSAGAFYANRIAVVRY